MLRRTLFLAMVVALAPGCSTVKGWFGGANKTKVNQPAELITVASPIAVKQLWSFNLGNGEGRLWLRQRPALDGGRLYAVSDGGSVVAIDAASGKQLWEANAVVVAPTGSKLKFWKREISEAGLSSSPGVGGGPGRPTIAIS